MLRKHFVKLASIMLVLVCMFSFATPAFAASGVKNDPYGYTWLDESTDVWYFQYYSAPNGDSVYSAVDHAYLKGNILYDADGDVISKSVRAMDDNPNLDTKPTVAFYEGDLYFLTTGGELCKMTASTATKFSKSTTTPTAKYFTLDVDGLGYKVGSTKLSSMSFSGTYSRSSSSSSNSGSGTNNTNKTDDFVLTHAYPGDPLKICYDAYRNDKLIISVYCKNANVWVETESLLLSETCVGAKFVGYSHDYYTILYDQDGTVYAFAYGDYDRALPISLGEEILSYKKDDNGFIESITTTRKTYNLDDLLDDYDDDDFIWMNSNIEYVTNSTSKSVAYDDDKDVVATLVKSSNYLYYDNTKLANSYKSTYFGFTKSGCAVWINNNSDLYYYDPVEETVEHVKANVTRVRYDDDGFVYQYTIGSKTYQINF